VKTTGDGMLVEFEVQRGFQSFGSALGQETRGWKQRNLRGPPAQFLEFHLTPHGLRTNVIPLDGLGASADEKASRSRY
jgi:hypothetical protein